MNDEEIKAKNGLVNALARATDALREAKTALEVAPAYFPGIGWTAAYRQSVTAMISSIEYLAKELGK
jgi:hypothetical protein